MRAFVFGREDAEIVAQTRCRQHRTRNPKALVLQVEDELGE